MQTFAKIILILINIGFIVAGALLIWLGAKSRNGHWIDIYTTDSATDVNVVATVLIALGSVVILIAFFGFAGAACRSRCLLTTYSIFVILGLIVFIAVTVLGFTSAGQANKWVEKEFPAEVAENDVAKGFNEVYCYAQGGRFCVTASPRESINTFFPSIGDTTLSLIAAAGIDLNSNTGLIGFCDQVDSKLQNSVLGSTLNPLLPQGYKDACTTCRDIKNKYGDYSAIFDWTNEQCPLTTASSQWCGQFLVSKNQSTTFSSGPYKQCRTPVLNLWKDYGRKAGIGGIVLSAISLILIFFACKAARSNNDDAYYGA